MSLTKRGLLAGFGGLVAAPALVRAEALMPISVQPVDWVLRSIEVERRAGGDYVRCFLDVPGTIYNEHGVHGLGYPLSAEEMKEGRTVSRAMRKFRVMHPDLGRLSGDYDALRIGGGGETFQIRDTGRTFGPEGKVFPTAVEMKIIDGRLPGPAIIFKPQLNVTGEYPSTPEEDRETFRQLAAWEAECAARS